MSKLVLVPNNMKSSGAKMLAKVLSDKLGYKVWRTKLQRVRKRIPFMLAHGTDKLTQLERFKQHEVPHPDFTTDRADTAPWLADGASVVCRRLLLASEGRGITIATKAEEVVNAPLYTRYMPKKAEFRVHVFDGQVLDVQQKKRRKEVNDNRDARVRNLANGYVFCRDAIVEPPNLRETATRATAALGYRIGAVDLAYNEKHNKLIVLEVNACPGMQGQTLGKYADAIIKSFNGKVDHK